MAGFFASAKTPWGDPGEVAIWLAVGLAAAIVGHNLTRAYQRRR